MAKVRTTLTIDELWAGATMSETKATELAVEAQQRNETAPTSIKCAPSLTSTSWSQACSAPKGSAEIPRASRDGQFELVVSEKLLA